jgi:hypothetical protein
MGIMKENTNNFSTPIIMMMITFLINNDHLYSVGLMFTAVSCLYQNRNMYSKGAGTSRTNELKKENNTSSLGRYVFGSEISYNKAPPRLPGLAC